MADVKITLPTCIPKSDEAVKRKRVAFGIAHLSPLAFVRLAALKAAKMSPVVGVACSFFEALGSVDAIPGHYDMP